MVIAGGSRAELVLFARWISVLLLALSSISTAIRDGKTVRNGHSEEKRSLGNGADTRFFSLTVLHRTASDAAEMLGECL